jgi:MinD-like ATPase involved in chromosome partitioning or flagellar assembly
MAKIISVHSFRGGTGKSNTTANVASLLAVKGLRVGVVDTDIQSPGIHVLFGLKEDEMYPALNDYLWGECEVQEAAHDVTGNLKGDIAGKVYLVPSSIKAGEIVRILREGYDVGLLTDGFHDLIDALNLDILLVDTHPGLNDDTLISVAISDAMAIILRPDQQDFQGTSVTVDVARKLNVPRLLLVLNKMPTSFDFAQVKATAEKTYGCEVAAILPHSDKMMVLQSAGIFALEYPDHQISAELRSLAEKLITD